MNEGAFAYARQALRNKDEFLLQVHAPGLLAREEHRRTIKHRRGFKQVVTVLKHAPTYKEFISCGQWPPERFRKSISIIPEPLKALQSCFRFRVAGSLEYAPCLELGVPNGIPIKAIVKVDGHSPGHHCSPRNP